MSKTNITELKPPLCTTEFYGEYATKLHPSCITTKTHLHGTWCLSSSPSDPAFLQGLRFSLNVYSYVLYLYLRVSSVPTWHHHHFQRLFCFDTPEITVSTETITNNKCCTIYMYIHGQLQLLLRLAVRDRKWSGSQQKCMSWNATLFPALHTCCICGLNPS